MSPDHTGTILKERYSLIRRLGRGGFADVWLARDIDYPRREVAVKILHQKHAANEDSVRRFLNEAKIVGSISAPNIVKVDDYGLSNGRYFLVMEYLTGPTLREELQRRRPDVFSCSQALRIIAQICDGLAVAATDYGVAHRDLKPENIFLERRPTGVHVTIVDFGIAKVVHEQELSDFKSKRPTTGIIGTPVYMAPELTKRLIGDDFPAEMYFKADIYSLGVIVYEMLTGDPPFEGPDTEVLREHLATTPMRPCEVHPGLDLPESVEALVMRCLEKSPHERFKSAKALGRAIRTLLASEFRDLPDDEYRYDDASEDPLPVDEEATTRKSVALSMAELEVPSNVVPLKGTRPLHATAGSGAAQEHAQVATHQPAQRVSEHSILAIAPAPDVAQDIAQTARLIELETLELEVPPAPCEPSQLANEATGERTRRDGEAEPTAESPPSIRLIHVPRIPFFTKIAIGAMCLTAFASMYMIGSSIYAAVSHGAVKQSDGASPRSGQGLPKQKIPTPIPEPSPIDSGKNSVTDGSLPTPLRYVPPKPKPPRPKKSAEPKGVFLPVN